MVHGSLPQDGDRVLSLCLPTQWKGHFATEVNDWCPNICCLLFLAFIQHKFAIINECFQGLNWKFVVHLIQVYFNALQFVWPALINKTDVAFSFSLFNGDIHVRFNPLRTSKVLLFLRRIQISSMEQLLFAVTPVLQQWVWSLHTSEAEVPRPCTDCNNAKSKTNLTSWFLLCCNEMFLRTLI